MSAFLLFFSGKAFLTRKIKTAGSLVALLSLNVFPFSAMSSPWLEAHDPFLRSDVTLLSDAGLLKASVNHYPLRWATIGDDLDRSYKNGSVSRANAHVRHALNSAKYLRGHRSAKAVIGNDDPISSDFGQFHHHNTGAYAAFETLKNSYAFRVSTGYAKHQGDTQWVWDNSYLALNAGKWLFSVGKLSRWWGQGWQHNLILGRVNPSAADVSVSYIDHRTELGGWSVETIAGFAQNSSFARYSASRLTLKPKSWLDLGITHQFWFDGIKVSEGDKQSALDAKVSLPAFKNVYHSLYAEAASLHHSLELGAYLYGWTGQFDALNHTWRLVLEKQQSTCAKLDATSTVLSLEGSHSDSLSSTNTYALDSSTSASLYLQMKNDHKVSVIVQDSHQGHHRYKRTRFSYQLPAIAGMVHAGVAYRQTMGKESDSSTYFWTGYEFRF
ncbi:MAG: capsule assembly Wzi family protein [Alteromonas sp.]|nr:capsule assembly Wzi family protein [Alteromonas sp.]